jgi:hypothetical protein
MAGKEKDMNKRSLHFDRIRKSDQVVIAWVNTIAAWMRVTPTTVGRLMILDGCEAFAKKQNIKLPTVAEVRNQSADAD